MAEGHLVRDPFVVDIGAGKGKSKHDILNPIGQHPTRCFGAFEVHAPRRAAVSDDTVAQVDELVPSLGHLVSPRCKRFDGIPDQALGLERRPDAIQATVKSNNFAKSLAEIQFYLFHVRKIAQIDDPPLGRQVPYQTRLGDKEAVSTTRERSEEHTSELQS